VGLGWRRGVGGKVQLRRPGRGSAGRAGGDWRDRGRSRDRGCSEHVGVRRRGSGADVDGHCWEGGHGREMARRGGVDALVGRYKCVRCALERHVGWGGGGGGGVGGGGWWGGGGGGGWVGGGGGVWGGGGGWVGGGWGGGGGGGGWGGGGWGGGGWGEADEGVAGWKAARRQLVECGAAQGVEGQRGGVWGGCGGTRTMGDGVEGTGCGGGDRSEESG